MNVVQRLLLALGCGGLGLWGATQWMAAAWGYHPDLGASWWPLWGQRLYAPHHYVVWFLAYGEGAPRLFLPAHGLMLGGVFLGSGLAWLWGLGQAQTVQSTTYGSSRWATRQEIARLGFFRPEGLILGQHSRRYLRHSGPEHALVFAPTRSGKGVGLVIPTLLSYPHSVVVHDLKGENWQLTAGFRQRFSRCLYFDPTSMASARFNPLAEIRLGMHEVRDAQNVADILVDPEGTTDRRDHWAKTGHALLVGAILHVLYAEPDKTLPGVATFLADPQRSFDDTLDVMMDTPHVDGEVHPVVASAARELRNKSGNELSGVLSTAMSFLGLYRDPIVARAVSASDFQLTDLQDPVQPVSLYLATPPSDINRTRPLMRLLLNQLGRRLTEDHTVTAPWTTAASAPRELLLLLDEFPLLGHLEFFQNALAYMAGYGLRALLITQSLNQLDHVYGPDNAIMDNCHVRVAFAANDNRTAKRITELLGEATEQREVRSHMGSRWALWLDRLSVSQQEVARPLLTPGEVMQLPATDALIFVGGQPPIRAHKVRYFADRNFQQRLCPPPPLAANPPDTGAEGAA